MDTKLTTTITRERERGRYLIHVCTNWIDNISAYGATLFFTFEVTGKSGKWYVKAVYGAAAMVKLETTVSTLAKAKEACELAIQGDLIANALQLKSPEIWRNSGGFLCIGGTYQGRHIYISKPRQPYALWSISICGAKIRQGDFNLLSSAIYHAKKYAEAMPA